MHAVVVFAGSKAAAGGKRGGDVAAPGNKSLRTWLFTWVDFLIIAMLRLTKVVASRQGNGLS